MGGEGFISSMNNSIKNNRLMLDRKDGFFKKGVNARYDKVANGSDDQYQEFIDPKVQEAIRLKMLRQRKKSTFHKFAIFGLCSIFVALTVFAVLNFSIDGYSPRQEALEDMKTLETLTSITEGGMDVKLEFYKSGAKCARTLYKDGLKHETSISFYESGEVFRSAAYDKGTLISETYFFKNGDVIAEFPSIHDLDVHHIKLFDKKKSLDIEFDFFDGKIIAETYVETVHNQL